MKVLPQNARLDFKSRIDASGLAGIVEAIGLVMAHTSEDVPHVDELHCVSGTAFTQYVYEPEHNQHRDDPGGFSRLGEFFSNYGPYESLSYYTGWDVREINGISPDDFWKLLRFELSEGRPVVSMGLGGPLQPLVVIGYEESPGTRLVTVMRRGLDIPETVDIASLPDAQSEAEVFVNWLVFVRPGEPAEWSASAPRQRIDVLRWAVRHARNPKEFFHETGESYASGLRGFESFSNFLERVDLEDLEQVSYLHDHLDRLVASRRAASRELSGWGAEVSGLLNAPEVEEYLSDAAKAYSLEVESLQSDRDIGERYREARQHEARAVDALEEALEYFPGPFAPIE